MAVCRASVEIAIFVYFLTIGRLVCGMPYEETMKSEYYVPTDKEAEILRENLLEALGLHRVPDVSKMNVSRFEYDRAFSEYLQRVEANSEEEDIDDVLDEPLDSSLRILRIDPDINEQRHRHHHSESRLVFTLPTDIIPSRISNVEIQLQLSKESSKCHCRLFQKIDDQKISLYNSASHSSQNVTVNVANVLQIRDKVKLYVISSHCSLRAASVQVSYRLPRRTKRSKADQMLTLPKEKGRTDCSKGKKNEKRCCRHPMKVSFRDLKGFEFILAPKEFNAYFCKGSCPSQYNPAHNHALLQFMLHKKDSKLAPKPCCAPAKLKHLEILHLNENDVTKLNVTKWKNVIVTECACS